MAADTSRDRWTLDVRVRAMEGHVAEASSGGKGRKEDDPESRQSYYCVIRLRGSAVEHRSASAEADEQGNVFWSEDFTFDDVPDPTISTLVFREPPPSPSSSAPPEPKKTSRSHSSLAVSPKSSSIASHFPNPVAVGRATLPCASLFRAEPPTTAKSPNTGSPSPGTGTPRPTKEEEIVVMMPLEDSARDTAGLPSLRLAISHHPSPNSIPTDSSSSPAQTSQPSHISLHVHEARSLASPHPAHNPKPYVAVSILPDTDVDLGKGGHGRAGRRDGTTWRTKEGQGGSPQWAEGFVIPVPPPAVSRILLLSVWDGRPPQPGTLRQAFLGMCAVEVRDLVGTVGGGERFYPLCSLPPGVDSTIPPSPTPLHTSSRSSKIQRRRHRIGSSNNIDDDRPEEEPSPVSPISMPSPVSPVPGGGPDYAGQLVEVLRKWPHRTRPAEFPVPVSGKQEGGGAARRTPAMRLPLRHDAIPMGIGGGGWLTKCGSCGGRVVAGGVKCTACDGIYHGKCVEGSECGGVGWVRIAVRARKIPLLPALAHAPLLSLLSRRSHRLCHLLGTAGTSDEIALALVRGVDSVAPSHVSHLHANPVSPIVDSSVPPVAHFVYSLLAKEMALGTTAAGTLFRANTVGTKCMDAYLKMVCKGYCARCVGQVVWTVVKDGEGWELDPAHLENPALAATHAARLGALTDRLLDGVAAARDHLPAEVRWVFRELRRGAGRRFEEGEDDASSTLQTPTEAKEGTGLRRAQSTRYSVVSVFLFLRLLVPAILGPRLFSLIPPDVRISPGAKRTLTLLAKIFQTIANLSDFGGKEAYMEVMNSYIHDRLGRMKSFLDHAATISDTEMSASSLSRARSHRPEKDLAILAARLEEVQGKIEKAAENDDDRELLRDLKSYLVDPMAAASALLPTPPSHGTKPGSRSSSPAPRTSASIPKAIVQTSSPFSISDSGDQVVDRPRPVTLEIAPIAASALEKKFQRPASPLRIDTKLAPPNRPLSQGNSIASWQAQPRQDAREPFVEHSDPSMKSQSHRKTDSEAKKRNTIEAGAGGSMQPAIKGPSTESKHRTTKSSIDAGYASPQVLVWMGDGQGQCACCEKPLVGFAVEFSGKKWQYEHFVCSTCGVRMKSSTASLSTDKLYCRTHTPTPHAPPTCGAKCGQPLGGPVIDALGQTFHQPCFTCADCSVQLRGRFFPARGRAYCQTCYRLSGAIVCQQCRGPIETEYFHINGAYFHTKCKTCDRCASTLFAGQYFTLEGVGLFCNSHRADMLVCRGCGLPVGGTSEGAGVLDRMVVSGQGRVYHVEHFTCASCGRNALGGEYVEGAAGVVVCRACKC